MKSVITAICLIIPLVIFFIIIDRKDFYSGDDVVVQEETIAGKKPTTGTTLKAVEQPAEKKSDETKPVDTKTISEEKPAPAAIPVLTPEEAIKANKANKEAFKIYQNMVFSQSFNSFCQKIGNKNHLFFLAIAMLPLLMLFDVLIPREKGKSVRVAKYFSLSRRISILFSVSLLVFGIFVFVPWSIYFGNSLQFPFIFNDFVNFNLLVLSISIVIICTVLLLIPPKISDYIVAAIAGLGLCVYVQAMFMNQHLGTMDGVEPIWSEHRLFGIMNVIIWIIIVLMPVVLRITVAKHCVKIISVTTGLVLFLEILATASVVFFSGQEVWSRSAYTYFADGSNQFQFSKEKNVVVFIFDNLGVEFIKLCFEQYPETRDVVKDFIWYDDARSNYRRTFPALHHELTGVFAQIPASSFHDLFERAWHSPSAKSFYKQVIDSGYDARLYCTSNPVLIGPPDCFHEYFSNIQKTKIQENKATYIIDYKRICFKLMKMSGFSFAPYFFKHFFFYSFDFTDNTVKLQVRGSSSMTEDIPIQNHSFYRKMISLGITANSNKPVFSIFYTRGTHGPWKTDEKCNMVEDNLDNPTPTTKSCFLIVSDFIRLLKEKKIYDKTTIMIISDHGAHEDLPGGLNPSGRKNPYDMAFMIKPFYENKQELTTDNSKVQSIDVLPTLLQILCGDNANYKDFEGFPPSKIPSDRIRKVYRMANDPDLPVFHGGVEFNKLWWNGRYNCLQEFVFVDAESFDFSNKTRSIPFVITNDEK